MGIEWLQHIDLNAANKHHEEPLQPWLFYTYIGISMALVTMAGLMSGLTLGLMSLDELDLEVLKRSGTEQEKKHARRIEPVIENEHHLLVTLLLFNALAAEALPIFLDKLVDPVTAVVLSVSVVLIIGEIMPQAVCRSYGLQVGSYSALFVRLLMALSAPISWPIGKLLDWLLGSEHSAFFRRAQLRALVGLHSSAEGLGGNLSADEISIITGALDLTSKTAWAAMTPLDKVFMLSSDRLLDEATLQEILVSGHSRIPLHEPGDRRQLNGLIMVKELVLVDPDQGLTAGQLVSRQLPRLPADTPLYQLLRLFESGGSHMVALTKPPRGGSYELGGTLSPGVFSPGRHPPWASGGLSRSVTPSGQGLPRIRSGVIKAGDNMIYVEAQQQTPQGVGSVDTDPMLNPMIVGSEPEEDAWGSGREGDVVGIITIEDVIEELLQQEIIDETDLYVDNMQVTRVEQYALTSNLPPRLRKAYVQQFTPRVGRLVAHHHPHSGGSGSWSHSHAGGAWAHHHHNHMLNEARQTFSHPTTPLNGSPVYPSTPPAEALRDAGGASTTASGDHLMIFRHLHSRLSGDYQQQQQQQQQQGQAQLQQQQQFPSQAAQLVHRHSAESGLITYTIASLGHHQPVGPQLTTLTAPRRSSDQGVPQGPTVWRSADLASDGPGGTQRYNMVRRSSDQGEGSTHRRYMYFQAVREGLMEGSDGGCAAGTQQSAGTSAAAVAGAAGARSGNDLQEPLLSGDDHQE